MAEILPFRGLRYADSLLPNIAALSSPLFDVVSEKHLRRLYATPHNSIHLSVPEGDNKGIKAAETLRAWREAKVLVQDDDFAIYPYFQYFNLPGQKENFIRKGFICLIKVEDYESGIIMRHEDTIPEAVKVRTDILAQSRLHISPTHGLYSDEERLLEPYLNAAMENPLMDVEDYQGVRDAMGKITDPEVIQFFKTQLKDKRIILADGHHRYDASVQLRQRLGRKEGAPEQYHMMYLTNAADPGLQILPTHRLLRHVNLPPTEELLAQMSEWFEVKPVNNPEDFENVLYGKKQVFGLVLPDEAFKLRLKESAFAAMTWHLPPAVRQLDVTILHYFFIWRILKIPQEAQAHTPFVEYERNLHTCLREVETGRSPAALILNPISMQEVQEVCYSGHVLPQKTTYFYPKAICGFVYGSIADADFEIPEYLK
jgi:uncharacterized protein (DUF1015 family)